MANGDGLQLPPLHQRRKVDVGLVFDEKKIKKKKTI
jgi:hypothetical protein